jgi:hypothetical protein
MRAIACWVALVNLIVASFVAAPIMLPLLVVIAVWQYFHRNRAQFRLSTFLVFVTVVCLLLGSASAIYHLRK